jgi:hypothetical protein
MISIYIDLILNDCLKAFVSYLIILTALFCVIVVISCTSSLNVILRGCIQKFSDWPPGARTANGNSSLPLGAVVSLFY